MSRAKYYVIVLGVTLIIILIGWGASHVPYGKDVLKVVMALIVIGFVIFTLEIAYQFDRKHTHD